MGIIFKNFIRILIISNNYIYIYYRTYYWPEADKHTVLFFLRNEVCQRPSNKKKKKHNIVDGRFFLQ